MNVVPFLPRDPAHERWVRIGMRAVIADILEYAEGYEPSQTLAIGPLKAYLLAMHITTAGYGDHGES